VLYFSFLTYDIKENARCHVNFKHGGSMEVPVIHS
jgi:hypothetical protein